MDIEARYRHYEGAKAVVIKAIAIALPLLFIIYTLDIPRKYFNFLFFPQSYDSLALLLMLTVVFLLVPAGKKSPRVLKFWLYR